MLKATRSTARYGALTAFVLMFMAATASAQTPQATGETQTVNLVEATMGRTLWMLAIFAVLIIIVIAFRRIQKKNKKK